MSDDFYSFYGSSQKTEEPKAEPEVKKSSNVQARKITNAPSASIPTPVAAERPLSDRDPRQIDQPSLVQQAQAGLQQAGLPQAPSAIDAISATGKDLLPYILTGGGTLAAAKLWDMFSKKNSSSSISSGPTTKELIEAEKLKQAQIKTAREQLLHENFVAKNTLTESEQLFGRKAKDATELRLMDKAYEQQKSPVVGVNAPTTNAPIPAAPEMAPASSPAPVVPTAAPQSQFDLNLLGQSKDPLAGKGWQEPVQPANVVSTGPTPEAAAAPLEKAAEVKEVTTPKKSKTEPKIPKPEFFKNAPSAERWMYGSMTKYMDQPISAQAVVARAADYLPEGTKFEMQPGGEGGGIHPDQKQHLNRFVSEQLGIPLKEGKLPDDFKFTTENRNKLAASVQSELETHAKAGTLGKLGKGALAAATLLGISEAVKAAQKGDYGPLKEAGFDIGLSVIPHPALQAAITSLTGTTLQPGTLPAQPFKSFENAVLGRKGVKEELEKLTKGKTGAEFNAIRDQYLYSNPRAVSDYDRAAQFFRNQAKQPVVPR